MRAICYDAKDEDIIPPPPFCARPHCPASLQIPSQFFSAFHFPPQFVESVRFRSPAAFAAKQRLRIRADKVVKSGPTSAFDRASICRRRLILRSKAKDRRIDGLVLKHLGDFGTHPVEQSALVLDQA